MVFELFPVPLLWVLYGLLADMPLTGWFDAICSSYLVSTIRRYR